MATTAVITRPTVSAGTESFLANTTHHVFSGMTSYVVINTAANMSRKISRWEWTFPDGQTKSGGVVQWCPTATGTGNVSLVCYGDDGTTSSAATLPVTVAAAPTFGTTKYFRSGGTDGSSAPHDGNTNLDANAWLTLNWGFLQWRNGNPHGSWGQHVLNKGQSLTFTGDNSFSTGAGDPDYGPLIIQSTGSGAHPVLNASDNASLPIAADGNHDGASLWSNPSIIDGIDLTYASPQGAVGHAGELTTNHPNNIFRNLVVTKGRISAVKTNVACDQIVFFNVYVTLGQFLGALGSTGGCNFVVLDSSTAFQNGNDGTTSHQCYFSSNSDLGIIDSTFDQNGATCFSGIKTSGCTRAYIARNQIKNCQVASDVGGNPGFTETDIVHDAEVLDNSGVNIVGFYTNDLLRLGLRNIRVYAGCSQEILHEQSGDSPHNVNTVDMYAMSANLITGRVMTCTTSKFVGFTIKNCAFVISGASSFYSFVAQADATSQCVIDYNVYWRVGGTPNSDSHFATINGSDISWAAWKLLGFDAHSYFMDPLFTGAKDVTPQSGSPCIWNGTTYGGTNVGVITKDVNGVARDATHPTIGAIEVAGGGGGGGGGGFGPSFGQSSIITRPMEMPPTGRPIHPGSMKLFGLGI